ncbi:hypothetical protein B0H14DRAFT_2598490 [Mycena olivaceomarginata]|nr:hypothetical protein B0H14DRAFT_2598490 [Mycena olivaceomarginata]
MSFALNGAQISGGTFNIVSGNTTQVFNLNLVPEGALWGQRLIDGRGSPLHTFKSNGKSHRGHQPTKHPSKKDGYCRMNPKICGAVQAESTLFDSGAGLWP